MPCGSVLILLIAAGVLSCVNWYLSLSGDDFNIVVKVSHSRYDERWNPEGCATYRSNDICLLIEANKVIVHKRELLAIIVSSSTVQAGKLLYEDAVRLGVTNTILVASDEDSRTTLRQATVPHIFRDPSHRQFDTLSIAEEVVLLGCNVLLINSLSVMQSDPFALLSGDLDFEVSSNHYSPIHDDNIIPSINIDFVYIRSTNAAKAALRSAISHRRYITGPVDSLVLFTELFSPNTDDWSHAGATVGFVCENMFVNAPLALQVPESGVSGVTFAVISIGYDIPVEVRQKESLLSNIRKSPNSERVHILRQFYRTMVPVNANTTVDACTTTVVVTPPSRPIMGKKSPLDTFSTDGVLLMTFPPGFDPFELSHSTTLFDSLRKYGILNRTSIVMQRDADGKFVEHSRNQGVYGVQLCSSSVGVCKWKTAQRLLQGDVAIRHVAMINVGTVFNNNPLISLVGDSDLEAAAVSCNEAADWLLQNHTVEGGHTILVSNFSGIDTGFMLLRNTEATRYVVGKVINNLRGEGDEDALLRSIISSKQVLPQPKIRIISRFRVATTTNVILSDHSIIPVAIRIPFSHTLVADYERTVAFFSKSQIKERREKYLRLANETESPIVWEGKWVRK